MNRRSDFNFQNCWEGKNVVKRDVNDEMLENVDHVFKKCLERFKYIIWEMMKKYLINFGAIFGCDGYGDPVKLKYSSVRKVESELEGHLLFPMASLGYKPNLGVRWFGSQNRRI